MEIESIPFDRFRTLTNCPPAPNDPDNHGCQWYSTSERRIAGRIYLDPKHEAFRYSVLRVGRLHWQIDESCDDYSSFQDAEAALFAAMRRNCGAKTVTVLEDVPPRLRFGKKARSTQKNAED